ncbi:MAG: hypothetical protein ACI8XM_001310 [Haloarculaceae archaeon]
MDRREFLAAVGLAGLSAGCLDGIARDSGEGSSPKATAEGTPTAGTSRQTPTAGPAENAGTPDVDPANARRAIHGRPPDICERSISPESGIYAITDPAFGADWSAHDVGYAYRWDRSAGRLADDQTVIGLETAEGPRAYPLSVLTSHEIVNDDAGVQNGRSDVVAGPVLVTFCPLCRSGMVARRRVGGDRTLFAVTGHLWQPERVYAEASENEGRVFGASSSDGEETSVRHNGNLVMYDAATRSYWSQMLTRGICGPQTGTELSILPSSIAAWGDWRERHPDTEVLLPPPHSTAVEPGVILGTENSDGDGPAETPQS